MAELYASVMDHARKFQHVTTPQGAFGFNQAFEAAQEEKADGSTPPKISVEIIDAVQRTNPDWSGMMEQQFVEYVIKLAISDDKIKIVGKRYSELGDFHTQLVERRVVPEKRMPPFPDKGIAHQNWWKFNEKDPDSEFVQQRKAALNAYLMKLFDQNPGLGYEPFVMLFFELEDLSMEAAIAASMKSAQNSRPMPPVADGSQASQQQAPQQAPQPSQRGAPQYAPQSYSQQPQQIQSQAPPRPAARTQKKAPSKPLFDV